MATVSTVGHTTFTTPSDREVALTRIMDAPRKFVWAASTSPEHVPHWMLGPHGWTMPVCEIDLRPGGQWRFIWRETSGREMEMRGVYREVLPPQRLANTESWGGKWPDTFNTTILTAMGFHWSSTTRTRRPALSSSMSHTAKFRFRCPKSAP